jgi:RNA polymerase-binding protein DksA
LEIVVETESLKRALEDSREDLLGRVERTHRHLYERKERVSANFSDQSQEMENQTLVNTLDMEGRAELKLIDEALDRMAAGTFGNCQKCGKQVQKERLAAVPYTRYCISCASQME